MMMETEEGYTAATRASILLSKWFLTNQVITGQVFKNYYIQKLWKMEDRFLFSIIKYKIILVDDKPAAGKESGCVRWNNLKRWGTLTPHYIFLSNYFLFVWTSDQNVCIPSPSVPGLHAALVQRRRACCGWLCAARCLRYFPSCCGISELGGALSKHLASTSGSVWQCFWAASESLFNPLQGRFDFFSYFDRYPGCCSERATALLV